MKLQKGFPPEFTFTFNPVFFVRTVRLHTVTEHTRAHTHMLVLSDWVQGEGAIDLHSLVNLNEWRSVQLSTGVKLASSLLNANVLYNVPLMKA